MPVGGQVPGERPSVLTLSILKDVLVGVEQRAGEVVLVTSESWWGS